MGVRSGYKQTDVGVVPVEWDAVRIGDLFTFKNGLNKAKKFFGHGTPIVNYMDVFGRPGLRAAELVGRVDVSPTELSAYEVRKGDVFFTRTSETVEEIGIASVVLDEPEKTVYSGFVLRARPIDESLDDLFKAYCFSPRYFRQQVTARASYTTRALTNGRSLSAALLARPPKPEQRAIAAALSDMDALLSGLDRLIAKKRDLRQAVMHQLLTGQTRLPGFHEEWKVVSMREVLTQNAAYGIVTTGAFVRNGVKMLRSGDIIDGRIKTDLPMVSREKSAEYIRTVLVRNDVVIALVGYPGASAKIPDELVGANISRAVGLLRLNGKVIADFLVSFLNSPDGRRMVLAPSAGSAQQVVNLAALNKLQFRIPPLPEQSAIASALSDMDAELAALEARRDKTRDLKQAMMQELLTGKTRLVPAGAAHA
jgi:type I restriction enzyme S subunit